MITWRLQDGVYELEMARDPLNEIGTYALERLETFLSEVAASDARVVLLSSSLRGGFSAGADLRELYANLVARSEAERLSGLRAFLDRVHAAFDRLDTLPLTVIGAVHGVCFGGGFELALCCDVIIADQTARFCFPELRLGIIPGFGGIPRLKREVGNAVVRDLLLSGRSMGAKRAHEAGIVSQVVAPGSALEVARGLAHQITKFDAEVTRTAKAFIKPLPRAELEAEKEHFLRLFQRPTVTEALRRFVEGQGIWSYLP